MRNVKAKRGLWYVFETGHPKKIFDNEDEALAYAKGTTPNDPDEDDDWEDDSELWEDDDE